MSVFLLRATLVAFLLGVIAGNCSAQQPPADESQIAAERFLNILLKRPQPGTALDRIHDYHAGQGTLDDLLNSLQNPGKPVDGISVPDTTAGATTMVAGLLQLQRGRFQEAQQLLLKAEELRPDDAICCYQLGKAFQSNGETSAAAEAMERAITKKMPRNVALPIFKDLGRLYAQSGQSQKAVEVWSKLEALFPGDHRIAGEIAAAFADDGNFDEALKRYQALSKSARRDDEKIAFAIQAAEMKRQHGDVEQANLDLEAILNRLRPGSWLSKSVRNRIEDGFLASGDVEGLVTYYRDRIQQAPDNLNLMIRLARVLIASDQLKDAADVLEQALERAPEDVEIRLTLIDVQRRRERFTAALQHYEFLAKLDPGNPDYLLAWGELILDSDEGTEEQRRLQAAKVWQRLADAHPEDSVTLATVADRLRSVKQSESALALYRQASELSPEESQYREYLGEYLHQLGQEEEAVEVWKSIAEGPRRRAETLIRLAEIYRTFDRKTESLDVWRQAAEFDLTFVQELEYVKRLTQAGQFAEAQQRLQRATTLAANRDEKDKLSAAKISTWKAEGSLTDRIIKLQNLQKPTASQWKELTLLYEATDQKAEASLAVRQALKQAPDDVSVIALAARLYEAGAQNKDAAEAYRRLARLDSRSRIQSFRKVALLYQKMLNTDKASQACRDLIAANPSSVDTYLFTADVMLNLGQSEEGRALLKRASRVAPRDTRPMIRLAAEHEKQFQSEEAIEIYWRAIGLEEDLSERLSIVRRLVPLYQATDTTSDLLARIRRFVKRGSDLRSRGLMLAAAFEELKEPAEARKEVKRLLARHPRDVELLQKMVDLCQQLEDLPEAVNYQQRIASLNPSEEANQTLVQLKLASGQIRLADVLSQQIDESTEPSDWIAVIRRARNQADPGTTVELARKALSLNENLWDVKLELVHALMGVEDAGSANEALRLCREIVNLNLRPETPAPSLTDQERLNLQNVLKYPLGPRLRSELQSMANFAPSGGAVFFVGRGSASVQRSAAAKTSVTIMCYADAWVLAYWNAMKMTGFLEAAEPPPALLLPEDLSKVDDPWKIVQYQTWLLLSNPKEQDFYPNLTKSARTPSGFLRMTVNGQRIIVPRENVVDDTALNLQRSSWRLFELAPEEACWDIFQHLKVRFWVAHRSSSSTLPTLTKPVGHQFPDNKPIDVSHLDLIAHYFPQWQASSGSTFEDMYALAIYLQYEFQLAGASERGEKLEAFTRADDKSFSELCQMIRFHADLGDTENIEPIVDLLMTAFREQSAASQATGFVNANDIIDSMYDLPFPVLKEFRLPLLEVVIAVDAFRRSLPTYQASPMRKLFPSRYSFFPNQAVTGSGLIYHQSFLSTNSVSGGFFTYQPLTALYDQETHQFFSLLVSELSSAYGSRTRNSPQFSPNTPSEVKAREAKKAKVLRKIAAHLLQSNPKLPELERITRRGLAAYVTSQSGAPEAAVEILADLHGEFPHSWPVKVELARYATVMDRHDLVLKALSDTEDISPDFQMPVQRFLLNSVIATNDTPQIEAVTNRLLKMNLDADTCFAVANKLGETDQKPAAITFLKRAIPGYLKDSQRLYMVATQLLSLGDAETANAIAVRLFEQFLNGQFRPPTQTARLTRPQVSQELVIGLLRRSGKLQEIVAKQRRLVDGSPSNYREAERFSRLLMMARMYNEAGTLHRDLAKRREDFSPADQIKLGRRLLKLGRYETAADIFLGIVQSSPDRLRDVQDELSSIARSGERTKVIDGLQQFPVEHLSSALVQELLQVRHRCNSRKFRYSELTSGERHLIQLMLQKSEDVGWALKMMNSLPKEEREKLPEFQAAVINVVRYRNLFSKDADIWEDRVEGEESPLTQLLSVATSDDEIRSQLLQRVKGLTGQTGSDLTAELLGILTDLSWALSRDQREEAEQLAEVLNSSIRKIDPAKRAIAKADPLAPEFVQQIIQYVRETDGLPQRLKLMTTLSLVRPVKISPRWNTLENSIVPDLIATFRSHGRIDLVRERLLALEAQDVATEDVRNSPTLWDNYLKRRLWIAEELLKAGAAPDALVVCRSVVTATSELDQYRRLYKGKTLRRLREFERRAVRSVSAENATDYLQQRYEHLKSTQTGVPSLNIILMPPTLFHGSDSVPFLQLVATAAAKSAEGRKVLETLQAFIARHDPQSGRLPEALAVQVTDAILASALKYQKSPGKAVQVPSLVTGLLGMEAELSARKSVSNYAQLYAILRAYPGAAQQAEFQQIMEGVLKSIRFHRDFGTELALREHFEFPVPMFDGHVAVWENDQPAIYDFPLLNKILLLASRNVAEGRYVAATKTLACALAAQPAGFGEWLCEVGGPSKLAAPKQEARKHLAAVLTGLNSLVDPQTIDGLTSADVSTSNANADRELSRELSGKLVDALLPIVFSEEGDIRGLYVSSIAPAAGRNLINVNFSKTGFKPPQSVSETLIRHAVNCGRLTEVNQRASGSQLKDRLLRIQLARYASDESQLVEQLKSFRVAIQQDVKDVIVASKSEPGDLVGLSAKKSRLINWILQAAWQTAIEKNADEKVQDLPVGQEANALLQMVVDLIESDSFTADRLSRISRIVQNQIHRK